MKILVVEDDDLQLEWIASQLQQAYPDAVVEKLRTELEFRAKLPEIASHPPSVVVLDLMLRWTDSKPDMEPPPEDVEAGGFYRAGLRCQELLSSGQRTKDVPVILYTVLDPADLRRESVPLPPNVFPLKKGDEELPLVRLVRRLTLRAPPEHD